ncbi:hypothetical protein AcW1_001771 [Taiwanofungus camphoratus]|nr:hypothetical protein AcV5_000181 [Antrodia cinnamomea]KAI0945582.1 hypothetical protein AcW1_001771 [Antrodia cinnamomea]
MLRKVYPVSFILLLLLQVWAQPYHYLRDESQPSILSAIPLNIAVDDHVSDYPTNNIRSTTGIAMGRLVGRDSLEEYRPITVRNISNSTWSKYDLVSYAYGETMLNGTVSFSNSNENQLETFVQLAHANDIKAMVTIGGPNGSEYFSTAIANKNNRTTLVNTLVKQYNLDGLDFDLGYFGKQNTTYNAASRNDSANFLLVLQNLHDANGNLILSAAVGLTPFLDDTGLPKNNVSDFAQVLDYIEIKNYDIWDPESGYVGPNAPLNDFCMPDQFQNGSAATAVTAWTQAYFPSDRILLGIASYGHSYNVSNKAALESGSTDTLVAYPPISNGTTPQGDSWDLPSPAD